ncbi:MAG: POTRA domain-containing protein [Candidatus Cloacimonadaceae bacterium]|nr:POTRA domain-containing protein [Candidatus Cloacimonadaceae bacterium]
MTALPAQIKRSRYQYTPDWKGICSALCFIFLLLVSLAAQTEAMETPRPLVGTIKITSSLKVSEQKLIAASGLQVGKPFHREDLILAAENIRQQLEKEGFSFVRVAFPELLPLSDGSIEIAFTIEELLPSVLNTIELKGLRYFTDARLRELLFLAPDSPVPLADLPGLMQRILQIYLSRGYLFARVELEDISYEGELSASIQITEGRPMIIKDYLFSGNKITRPNTLILLSNLSRQRTITPEVLRQAEQNILRKSYIRDCQIIPLDEDRIQISIQETRMTTMEGVVGYNKTASGNRDLSGLLRLKFLNLWGTDRSIQLYWRSLPTGTSELEFSYHESGSLAFPVAADISLYRMVQDSTWIKTRSHLDVYYYMLYQRIGMEFGLEQLSPGSRRPMIIEKSGSKSIGALWSYARTDHAHNPSSGNEVDLRYRFIFTDQDLGKRRKNALLLDVATYYPFTNRVVGAISAHIRNLNDPSAREHELFSMGGFNSMRGFAEDNFKSWRLGWTSYELRYRITPETRTYVFFDQAFIATSETKLKYDVFGLGFGLRVQTRLGILGLEYALGYQDKRFMDIGSGMIHLGLDVDL